MIELDGSYLEGGGQILRTAVGMSAYTGQACRVYNIRAGRSKPGLMPQHLKSIEAVAFLCHAQTDGLEIGSNEIVFFPGEILTQSMKVDVGTAGSVTLILQALLIPSTRIKNTIEIELTGGTHVSWSPTFEYFKYVFCPILEKMGYRIQSDIERLGFYPKGGGKIRIRVEPPEQINSFNPERSDDEMEINGYSCASESLFKAKVAERQLKGAAELLSIDHEKISYDESYSSGSSLVLAAQYRDGVLGADCLGKQGLPAEEVGRRAAQDLLETIKTQVTVDAYMSDQILPYLAMAKGESLIAVPKLTGHVRTNIWVIEKFLDTTFTIFEKDSVAKIWCSGSNSKIG